MRNHFNSTLKALMQVFLDGKYLSVAINSNEMSEMSTLIYYGVLENNIKLDYIVSQLVQKKPKTDVETLLKIGIYALMSLDKVPDFAIVSECVEVMKMNGKAGLAGFVNAVLKRAQRKEYVLPKDSDDNFLSIQYSKPQWFIDKLISEVGKDKTTEILAEPISTDEHARVNLCKTDIESLDKYFAKIGIRAEKSAVGGYFLQANENVRALMKKGLITYQSASSMLVVDALAPVNGAKILDLCSAPGGKAIYIAQKCPKSTIDAVDLHPHRIKLIESYKKRMGIFNVNTSVSDATKFNPEFEHKYDFVLVDAPCTCFGTFKKHPDVFLNKSEKSILSLQKLQRQILDNAVRYVADDGVLVYSTCTLFKEENMCNVDYILQNSDLTLEKMPIAHDNNGTISLMPEKNNDGFFIARFRKTI